MFDNNPYTIERFNRILEKVDAGDLFDISDDGYLTVLVHTGKITDSFRINVEFQGNSITVTTHSALGVEDENRKRVQILLDSINRMHGVGKLFIGGESSSVVSFKIKSDFRELENLDNPFDLVFMGSSLIIDYSESIIKTLMGANIFYMRAFE